MVDALPSVTKAASRSLRDESRELLVLARTGYGYGRIRYLRVSVELPRGIRKLPRGFVVNRFRSRRSRANERCIVASGSYDSPPRCQSDAITGRSNNASPIGRAFSLFLSHGYARARLFCESEKLSSSFTTSAPEEKGRKRRAEKSERKSGGKDARGTSWRGNEPSHPSPRSFSVPPRLRHDLGRLLVFSSTLPVEVLHPHI